MFKLLLSFLFITNCWGTTFKLLPIVTQVTESDAVFMGNYLKSKTVELEDGKLATQMYFKMNKEVGLNSDFYGMDEVIIHFPGGKLPDRSSVVEGVPKFVSGEKVMLFVKSLDNRYWGMNLGYGSFKVINYGKEIVLVNYLFPEHAEVGQVSLTRFEEMLREIKGANFKVVYSPQPSTEESVERQPASVPEGQNRTIASKSNQSENESEQSKLNVLWLLMLLGFTGGFYRLWNRKAQ